MAEPLARYDHIEGMEGKVPVGCQIAIGLKLANGNIQPGSNDRFYVKVAAADRPGKAGVRVLHPAFEAYNNAPKDRRQVMYGNFVHAEQSAAWTHQLMAYVLGKRDGRDWPAHPRRKPSCVGDGVKATRYFGEHGEDDFREIACPHHACPFYGTDCKAFGRVYFRPDWAALGFPNLPPILARWETRSPQNVDAWVGFWKYIQEQAQAWGLPGLSAYAIPFAMSIQRKTNPAEKSNYPIISVSVNGDLLRIIHAQRKAIQAAGGVLALPAFAGAEDDEENAPDALAESWAELSPGPIEVPHEVVVESASEPEPPASQPLGKQTKREQRSKEERERLAAAALAAKVAERRATDYAVNAWGQIPRHLSADRFAELLKWVEAGGPKSPPPAPAQPATDGSLFS